MVRSKYFKASMLVTVLAITALVWGGCFGGINTMGLHLFSMKIEVRGPNNAALVGAVVHCSCGETVTVDTTGIATLHFSDIGPYYVSVVYQDRVISSYNVSMPSDGGKTLTTNYLPGAQPTTGGENAPSEQDNSGLAMMASHLYPILFQYMFSAYGYSMELNPYQPGQYTDWNISGKSGKPFETRKAFLTTMPDGKEWWGLTYVSNKDSIITDQLAEPDVLVVGAGNAAANAALAAREAGATVAVLEAAPEEARAGNSAFTGGAFRFVHHGVKDLVRIAPDIENLDLANIDFGTYTTEQFFDDMGRLTEYRCDPELTELLIGGSTEAALWLKRHGVRFQPALGRQAFKVGGRFRFWGGLACHVWGGGLHLTQTLHEALARAGIPVIYRTEAVALLQDDARIRGVRALHRGRRIDVRARSVVLACGGFQSNAEMRARYLGPNWDLAKVRGTRTTPAGAIVWHWMSVPLSPATGRAHMPCNGT